MIYTALEGDTTWFSDLTLSDIPHPLPRGISIHARGGELGIEAQGLVGAIPLLNGCTLQITPKIGQVNFLRLLFKAEGLQADLEREYNDFVEYYYEEGQGIDSIVARNIFISASEIISRSPICGRVMRRNSGAFASGQMDTIETALNLYSRKSNPVVFYRKEKTLDIPENRILSEALIRAWYYLDENDRRQFQEIFEKWGRKYPRSGDIEGDLEHVERGFALEQYGGSRDYYRKALMLAQILLGSSGLGFNNGSTVAGDAVLLNTASIFEQYLRNVIRAAYNDIGYVVTKSGLGIKSLYTDGSFELEPDIVISKDGRTILIADAKYKKPTAADHYQMQVYLAANRVDRGILLSPLFNHDEGNIYINEYATVEKRVVSEVYLPIHNPAITEEFLRSIVERFG